MTERIDKETALRPDNSNAMVHGAIGLAYIGELERAKDWVTRALIIEPDDTDDRYNVACAFAQMNEPEEALTQLECCIPKMPPEIVNWMKQDSDLVPLQSHPRYLALIAEAEARLSATETKADAPAGT